MLSAAMDSPHGSDRMGTRAGMRSVSWNEASTLKQSSSTPVGTAVGRGRDATRVCGLAGGCDAGGIVVVACVVGVVGAEVVREEIPARHMLSLFGSSVSSVGCEAKLSETQSDTDTHPHTHTHTIHTHTHTYTHTHIPSSTQF
eukprot:352365-Chlamydomonas_euryale.AAC.5